MVNDAEAQRILGYLQQQAAEKSIEELIARVREGVDEVHQSAFAVPPERRETVPEHDEWAPGDALRHLVGSNAHVSTQILHVALTGALHEGEEPAPAGTFEELVAKHDEAIESLFAHVREADPAAHLEVKWRHPFFGDLNWREWLIFLRIHCRDHARQITALSGGQPS